MGKSRMFLVLVAMGFIGTLSSCKYFRRSEIANEELIVSAGIVALKIMDVSKHWNGQGYALMTPMSRDPSEKGQLRRVRTWLKVPAGKKISVEFLVDQKRPTLVFPPGTISDRSEVWSFGRETEWVVDIRGTRIAENGQQFYHVYVPTVVNNPAAQMLGYEWKRGDARQVPIVAEALVSIFNAYPQVLNAFPGAVKSKSTYLERYKKINDCFSCHVLNKPDVIDSKTFVPRRSDSAGFFTIQAVLAESLPVSYSRDWDLNADDPFYSAWCGKEPAELVEDMGLRGFTCKNGAVPVGRLDMSKALAARDAHALAVCDSRKYLFENMDDQARKAFHRAFVECKIVGPGRVQNS
jgi:hypothetical protein